MGNRRKQRKTNNTSAVASDAAPDIGPVVVPKVLPAAIFPRTSFLKLPNETLSKIVECSICLDFEARVNLVRTNKLIKGLVKDPVVTRRFAVHHWGNSTHAILELEKRRKNTRDSYHAAFFDSMDDIAAGIDYENPAEVERLRACRGQHFTGVQLAPTRMHLATFAIATLVVRRDVEYSRYDHIKRLVRPFLQQLEIWKKDPEQVIKYRR